MRAYIVDTWNGGTQKPRIAGVVQADWKGLNVMGWFHDNTPFSQDEALKKQGYRVVFALGWAKNYDDRINTHHLVIDSTKNVTDETPTAVPACGSRVMLHGQVEEDVEGHKCCTRCLAYLEKGGRS